MTNDEIPIAIDPYSHTWFNCQHDEQIPAGLKHLAMAYDLPGFSQDIRHILNTAV
ncbi:hypothetical protein [Chitinophaga silvisoli]|uniref:hypothetical protein n=1 Tax=Chitinophaga silvisoli TaxID=2291814 RepID=UPI0013143637|nr:hypothetical protein [Chitinophaga silvisoli]